MRFIFKFAAILGALLASRSILMAAWQTEDGPGIIRLAQGDPEMAAAVRKAVAALNDFLAMAADPPATASDFSLKVGLPLNEKDVEFVWVRPFRRDGADFVGRLVNTPRDFPGLKFRQPIKFERVNMIDFAYRENVQIKGHHTTCVLLKRMPQAKRAEILAANPIACEP